LLIDNINVWKIFLITDIQIFDNTDWWSHYSYTRIGVIYWYVPTRKKKIEEKKESSKPTQPEFFFLTSISLVYTIIIITIICAGIVCVYIGTRVTWRKSGRTREERGPCIIWEERKPFFWRPSGIHLYACKLRYEDNDDNDGFIVKFYCPMSPYYRNDFYGLVIYIYMYNKSSPVQLLRENDEIHAHRICVYYVRTLLYITRTLGLFSPFALGQLYDSHCHPIKSPSITVHIIIHVCIYVSIPEKSSVYPSTLRHPDRPRP
jgi:hypothetical protein